MFKNFTVVAVLVASESISSLVWAQAQNVSRAPVAKATAARAATAAPVVQAANPAIDAQRVRLGTAVRTEIKAKLKAPVRQVVDAAAKREVTSARLFEVAKASLKTSFGERPSQDIESLAFIVMMEAEQDARKDLKEIIGRVKAINEVRECKRDPKCLEALASKGGVSKEMADKALQDLKNKVDSMSEMGEVESLRLQMAMDRLSKLMSTLSNLLKKISDTSQSIVQNIK